MSHVDDGSLHAYLDGALDDLPAAEAERIRSHLASCAVCAARLEEERAWRREAETVLAYADPGVGDVPPFEEVRARAAARPRPGPGLRLRRLAWAASVVVAGGTGWLLRGSQGHRFESTPAPIPAAIPAEAPTQIAAEGVRAPVPSGLVDESPTPEAPVASAASKGLAEAADVAGRTEVGAALAEAPAPPAPTVEPFRTDQEPGFDVNRRVQAAARLADQTESATQRERVVVLGIPGLPVLSFTTHDARLPPGATRVLQLLASDTLELIHLPSGSDTAFVAGLAGDGRIPVLVPRGNGWLVGRARVTPDSLRALLEQVRGGGG